jgi:hypothetical protein
MRRFCLLACARQLWRVLAHLIDQMLVTGDVATRLTPAGSMQGTQETR